MRPGIVDVRLTCIMCDINGLSRPWVRGRVRVSSRPSDDAYVYVELSRQTCPHDARLARSVHRSRVRPVSAVDQLAELLS